MKRYFIDLEPSEVVGKWLLPFNSSERSDIKQIQIISGFGAYRSGTVKGHKHSGIDIIPSGRMDSVFIYPANKGRVCLIRPTEPNKTVIIRHKLTDGTYIYSSYIHLKDIFVNIGDEVDHDTKIGVLYTKSETTKLNGNYDHLHFEIKTRIDDYSCASWLCMSQEELDEYFENPLDFLKRNLNTQSQLENKKVAITIDDVPNTIKYLNDNFKPILLSKLDSLNLPVTIFVTTGLLYKTDNIDQNTELLSHWIKRTYTTIGYHSHNHLQYSQVKIDYFKLAIEEGEPILKTLTHNYKKTVSFFRFPYNDLGKDSIQHLEIVKYITSKGYKIAPFTVESEDWMYNYIYEYYLEKKDYSRAREIAKDYISTTLRYFDFFDSLAVKLYGRTVNQIYLCHDNRINADYLTELVNELKRKNYSFISLYDALSDKIYDQEDKYYDKWGISWLYRWMKTPEEISYYSRREPYDDTYKLYKQLVNEKVKQTNSLK